jgi:hypothetical protein
MNINLFTSNQPRHIALAERLARVASVTVFCEATTVHTGKREGLHRRSDTMERYFRHVLAAERTVFGGLRPFTVPACIMAMGDLSQLDPAMIPPGNCVVFASSYIQGPVCDELLRRGAVNIHMGVSPQYRGSSCNFWAAYDGHPELVGATIHLLSKGLDNGGVLDTIVAPAEADPWIRGMKAVESVHHRLVGRIQDGTLFGRAGVPQDRALQIRYSKGIEFTDAVAEEFMRRHHRYTCP